MNKEGDHMIIHHKYNLDNPRLLLRYELEFMNPKMRKIDHQIDEKSLFVYIENHEPKEGTL